MISVQRRGFAVAGTVVLAWAAGMAAGGAAAANWQSEAARDRSRPRGSALDPAVTGENAEDILAKLLPPRTDALVDWRAPLEPLHHCGEPRFLPPCVPPPPCHPAQPPAPYDLVGRTGTPSRGPLYAGPCCPRTGSHDADHLPRVHRVWDRWFDLYYRAR